MHILFTTSVNKNSQVLFPLTLLLLVSSIYAQECQAFNYHSGFTRCQISLDQCRSPPESPGAVRGQPYFNFKKCQIDHCVTLGAGPECRSFVTIELE